MMRLLRCGVVLCSLSATAIQAQAPKYADPATWFFVHPNEPVKPELPGVSHHRVRSAAMDREVGVNVLVPSGYDAMGTKRYPVVYFLHGATGHEGCRGYAPLLTRLMTEGKVPPSIWVFPNGGQRSMWRDGPEGHTHRIAVDTFVMKELIPHIDAHWRTNSSREGRGVCGFSMGGYGSVRFAFKYPNQFAACLSISGGAFEPKSDEERQQRPADHYPTLLLNQNRELLQGRLALKLIAGMEDFNFQPVKGFATFLEKEKFSFEQEYPVGLKHSDLGKYFTPAAIAWLHGKLAAAK